MNPNGVSFQPVLLPITKAEKIALAMLAASAKKAARGLHSTVLAHVADAIEHVAKRRFDLAAESVSDLNGLVK